MAPLDIAVPKVTPMPRRNPLDHDYPFFTTDIDHANHGDGEEEFMTEGTADTSRQPSADGTIEIAEHGIPYRTRLIVRRPTSAARFNGVAFVEWFNVTNQYDTDVLWL